MTIRVRYYRVGSFIPSLQSDGCVPASDAAGKAFEHLFGREVVWKFFDCSDSCHCTAYFDIFAFRFT